MSHTIIDRTVQDKSKSSGNRVKFTKRAATNIKEAVKDYIANSADIKSIADGKDKKVKVSKKTLNEPMIVHGDRTKRPVVIGNKEYEVGDKIAKPKGGGASGNGKQGAPDGDGEDDFYFQINHKEFLDIFFDDLELPDLIKKQITEESEVKPKNMGYTTTGSPVRLDLRKTLMNSYKRHFAIDGFIQSEIDELNTKLLLVTDLDEIASIKLKIEELEHQRDIVPFLEELDLRYKNIVMVPEPATKAVMFCILDVSGSMTQWHKETAKRFFMILYLFLTKQYENVELVFIKHHHLAYEVDEKDFFYSRATGGTVVSEALKLTKSILSERYSNSSYNSYVCQISDGDNYDTEEENSKLSMYMDQLLPLIQYFAFIDVKSRDYFGGMGGFMSASNTKTDSTTLMDQYIDIKDDSSAQAYKMNLRSIMDISDIYPVFRSLFEKGDQKK